MGEGKFFVVYLLFPRGVGFLSKFPSISDHLPNTLIKKSLTQQVSFIGILMERLSGQSVSEPRCWYYCRAKSDGASASGRWPGIIRFKRMLSMIRGKDPNRILKTRRVWEIAPYLLRRYIQTILGGFQTKLI